MAAPQVASSSRLPVVALSRQALGLGRALPCVGSQSLARAALQPAPSSGQLRLQSSSARSAQASRPIAGQARAFQSISSPSLLSLHAHGPARGVVSRHVQPLLSSRFSTTSMTRSSSNASSTSKSSSSSTASAEEELGDEPPPKASFRERMRFLSKRYGWWALLVYMLASLVDFTAIFLAIHLLGAEHIRELETRFRRWIGMGEREMKDEEVAAWPVPVDAGDKVEEGIRKLGGNNADEAKKAGAYVKGGAEELQKTALGGQAGGGKGDAWISSTLWTEIVLAYTIHKTLFLPFRVAVTAAVTPAFVKHMVRLGWAKPNNAVKVGKKVREAAAKASS